MIYIVQYARMQSTRVPNKIGIKYKGISLIEHGEDYIEQLIAGKDIGVYIVCPEEDKNLFSLPTLIQSEDYSDWVGYLSPIREALSPGDVIWHANIFCHPLMEFETGYRILDACKDGRPMVTVYPKRGSIWDENQNRIYGDGLADTKNNKVYYEYAHHGYVIPYEYLIMSADNLSKVCSPLVLEPSWRDKVDIDTLDDLDHLRHII